MRLFFYLLVSLSIELSKSAMAIRFDIAGCE